MPAIATVRIDDRIAKRQLHVEPGKKLRLRDDGAKDGPFGPLGPPSPPGPPGNDGKDGHTTSQTLSSQTATAHATATVLTSPQQTASLATSSTSFSSAQQLSTSTSTSQDLTTSTSAVLLTTIHTHSTTLPSSASTMIQTYPSSVLTSIQVNTATPIPGNSSSRAITSHDSTGISQGGIVALASIGIIGGVMTLAFLAFFCFRQRQKIKRGGLQRSSSSDTTPARPVWGGAVAPSETARGELPHVVSPIAMPENQAHDDWFAKLKRYSRISYFMTPRNPPSGNHIRKDTLISRTSEFVGKPWSEKHESKAKHPFGNGLKDGQENGNTRRMTLVRSSVGKESSDELPRGSQYWTRMVPRAMRHSTTESEESMPRWKSALSWAKDQSRRNGL